MHERYPARSSSARSEQWMRSTAGSRCSAVCTPTALGWGGIDKACTLPLLAGEVYQGALSVEVRIALVGSTAPYVHDTDPCSRPDTFDVAP